MTDIQAFIRGLPKAELHLHIEGTFEPELMFALAERNNVKLSYPNVEALRQAYNFSNLQDFLDIYYQGMSVLITEQDFYDLTMAYLKRSAADNVRHVEIFFDPQGHTERGVAFATAFEGIYKALADGERDLGISFRFIMSYLRHLPEEDAFVTWNAAQAYLDRIDGIGLDSSEKGNPPENFERVYAAARDKGLKLVAHAGEEGPPSYVYAALDQLKVDRIDHGNRALEDAALVQRLVNEGITLTVCPQSNLRLCVVDDMKNHPLKTMLDLGLKATVNSDDPAYFGGYVNDNYIAVAEALNLSRDELVTLAKNSFNGSFLGGADIAKSITEIDEYVGKTPDVGACPEID